MHVRIAKTMLQPRVELGTLRAHYLCEANVITTRPLQLLLFGYTRIPKDYVGMSGRSKTAQASGR